jgi:hypothetical protein
VIAFAHRLVESQSIHKLQKVQREDLEHELTFLGKNKLFNLFSSTNSPNFNNIRTNIFHTEQALSFWKTD